MKKAFLAACMMVALASPAISQAMDRPMGNRGPGPMGEGCPQCDMDRGHDMEYHGMGDMIGRCLQMADKLGLSDDQVNKIKPLVREMRKKQIRFRADIQIAQMDLREIMDVKDFDLDKANAAVKKIADMQTEHRLVMLKTMKDVRAILTDDQFKQMHKMMPRKMECHKPPRKMMQKGAPKK